MLLCFFVISILGVPSSTDGCRSVTVESLIHKRNLENITFTASPEFDSIDNVSVKVVIDADDILTTDCYGKIDGNDDNEVLFSNLQKNDLYIITKREDVDNIFKRISQGNLIILYSCHNRQNVCLELKMRNISKPLPILSHTRKRDLHSIEYVRNTHVESVIPQWIFILGGIGLTVVLLSFATALCVKSNSNEVPMKHTGLRIIDKPPEEYLSSNVQVTEHTNAITDSSTQEVRLQLGSVSSSSPISHSSPVRNDSVTSSDQPKSKKGNEPLPLPPDAQDLVVEQKPPYDSVRVSSEDKDNKNHNEDPRKQSGDIEKARLPGSYAKVTRHSDSDGVGYNPVSSYAEVREISRKQFYPQSRLRSSTEPVEPIPPLPPGKPRAFSSSESNQLPLPPTPLYLDEDEYDDTYDSVRDDLKSSLLEKEKLYDSLDDDENEDEMYESVPDDLKEELLISHNRPAPIPVPPRSPKLQPGSTGSPSPTKVPSNLFSLDSPNARKMLKKQAKEAKRKTRSETTISEDEQHKPKLSFLHRIRSSSTSVVPVKSRKRTDGSLISPEHPFPSIPPPPPPVESNYEDESGMYDSVTPSQRFHDVAKKSASLPPGLRSSLLFSSRANEPLPEVPEDSGSASGGACLVKRDRTTEQEDPSYDTVNPGVFGRQNDTEENEDDENEPSYDTVQIHNEFNPPQPDASSLPSCVPSHSYAKVTGHNPPSTDSIVNAEYAVVDPNVVMRKRVASMSKKNDDGNSEPPYDRVKEGSDPPYDRVKTTEDPPYDKVKKIDETSKDEESGYDTVGTFSHNITSDLPIDEEDPGYDTVMICTDVQLPSMDPQIQPIPTNIDDTYSHIDLIKKHEERRRKEQGKELSTDEVNRSPSPLPPIPPVGDLGDLSEFIPPPIPSPLHDIGDESSKENSLTPPPLVLKSNTDDEDENEQEPDYDVINEVMKNNEAIGTDKLEETSLHAGNVTPPNNLRQSTRSTSSSEGAPVYDSLEPQLTMYDSLDPKESSQQPLYDSLQPQNQET